MSAAGAHLRARSVRVMALASLVASIGATGACVPGARLAPNTDVTLVAVRMRPDEPWTDTGLVVRRGDRLYVTARGEIFWDARGEAAGPDGIKGYPGWSVGAGGLVGRVEGMARSFDVGARTEPFLLGGTRRPYYYSPPPIGMPRDGRLWLGFKHFTPGDNRGAFDVTIRPSRPRT